MVVGDVGALIGTARGWELGAQERKLIPEEAFEQDLHE